MFKSVLFIVMIFAYGSPSHSSETDCEQIFSQGRNLSSLGKYNTRVGMLCYEKAYWAAEEGDRELACDYLVDALEYFKVVEKNYDQSEGFLSTALEICTGDENEAVRKALNELYYSLEFVNYYAQLMTKELKVNCLRSSKFGSNSL